MPKSLAALWPPTGWCGVSQATQPKWSPASKAADRTASSRVSPSFLRSTQVIPAPRATGRYLSSSQPASKNTRAGASPIAPSSELIAGSEAVSPTMTYPAGRRLGDGELAAQHRRLDRVAGLRRPRPVRRDALVQGELDVDCVGRRVGVDQRVTALVQLVAVGEPHPDPHRRVHGMPVEHPAGVEAQPQVLRADLTPTGHGESIVPGTE